MKALAAIGFAIMMAGLFLYPFAISYGSRTEAYGTIAVIVFGMATMAYGFHCWPRESEEE